MARILVAVTGQTGITNACLELGHRLTAAGHALHFTAPRPVGNIFADAGLAFTALPPLELSDTESVLTFRHGPRPAWVPKRAWHAWLRWKGRRWADELRRAADRLTAARDFVALGQRIQPNLVLIDVELHEYILAAYGEDWKVAHLSQWYGIWRRPNLPYPLTDVRPDDVGVDAARIDAVWEQTQRERSRQYRAIAGRSYASDRRSALLRAAENVGFPPEELGPSFWPGPLAYRTWPTLLMVPYELEFPHVPRPGTIYVGPMVAADRPERGTNDQRGLNAAEIIRRAGVAGQKILVGTVSTLSAGDVDFLQRLLVAVGRRPEWCLLLGVRKGLLAELHASAPGNVHLFGYLPQLEALAAADLSINHGGIHTIHEALHFGVPQLVYSGKRSDQPGCAARVAYHGMGVKADKDTDTAADIERRIAGVLADEEIGRRVGETRAAVGRYARERTLEETVAKLLAGTVMATDEQD